MLGEDAAAELGDDDRPARVGVGRDDRWRVLGDVIVGRLDAVTAARAAGFERCVLCLPAPGLGWRSDERMIVCSGGESLLVDPAADPDAIAGISDPGLVVVLPRRRAAPWFRPRPAVQVVAPLAGMEGVVRLVEGLLSRGLCLDAFQAKLAGRALSEWLVTVVAPEQAMRVSVADRREASLLDRLAAHIDGHLADDLDVTTLCRALGCSRSALYRATVPVGGVAAFTTQRRLSAAHAKLGDADERGTIAAIARACGFRDPAGFSRVFKRHFTVTAADVRRRAADPRDRTTR